MAIYYSAQRPHVRQRFLLAGPRQRNPQAPARAAVAGDVEVGLEATVPGLRRPADTAGPQVVAGDHEVPDLAIDRLGR